MDNENDNNPDTEKLTKKEQSPETIEEYRVYLRLKNPDSTAKI